MKFKLALSVFVILIVFSVSAQQSKYIEVVGSAEMSIEPDEFIFVIGIEEYWKEEFEKNKEFEDYKNKIKISEIEGKLIKDLNDLGIKTKQIKSTDVGNYWRHRGKEFLVSKKLEITLTEFKLINKIISKIDTKGIDYMAIGELKNKDLVNYRKDIKKQALLAAKEKATYLLETLGKDLGDVISITEINAQNHFPTQMMSRSNTLMSSSENTQAEHEKKIKLRYEINAKFEIK